MNDLKEHSEIVLKGSYAVVVMLWLTPIDLLLKVIGFWVSFVGLNMDEMAGIVDRQTDFCGIVLLVMEKVP